MCMYVCVCVCACLYTNIYMYPSAHVPKCMSCHKATVVITGGFIVFMITHTYNIYIYNTYKYIYKYICTYRYICMYVCVCMYVCIYIYIYIYIYICIIYIVCMCNHKSKELSSYYHSGFAATHTLRHLALGYMYIFIYTYMYTCMYVCMYVCMYMYKHIYIHIYTCILLILIT